MFWLYEQVLQEDPSRAPLFAEQSAINWPRALNFEIVRTHGSESRAQLASCRREIRNHQKLSGRPLAQAVIFEALFGAITNAMSLHSHAQHARAWDRPSMVVTWYYAVYWAVRAIFAAVGQNVGDNHSSALKTFATTLRPRLPHPFNMHARHVKNEKYRCILPVAPEARGVNISGLFAPTAEDAQGMILEYLSGTAQWYVERTKDTLRRKEKTENFRTKKAQDRRNECLAKDIGFLHCAFRYRTKANYRDAVYLSYGNRELTGSRYFAPDLAATAAFFTLIAFAFCEWHIGKTVMTSFIEDLRINLRGVRELTEPPFFLALLDVAA